MEYQGGGTVEEGAPLPSGFRVAPRELMEGEGERPAGEAAGEGREMVGGCVAVKGRGAEEAWFMKL